MKIAHIVGNRPQFIKLALLHDELQKRAAGISLIIHTGQHFDADMSAIFFGQLHIPPPDHLMQIHGLSHNDMIGNMLIAIDPILDAERPDAVIVYGDTNTTLAGALAAKKRNIPLAHVEAGVRTGKEDMPEESNRYLADRMSNWNFTCTPLGKANLAREGYGIGGPINSEVHVSGDLMRDAALRFGEKAREMDTLVKLRLKPPFILATIHRAENTGDPEALREIVEGLNRLHQKTPVLFPIHPRTRQAIEDAGIVPAFLTSPPLGYLEMLGLVQHSCAVITDSGGLSREAFFFGKPALVVMENPFWPELFEHGACLRTKASKEDIVQKYEKLTAVQDALRSKRANAGKVKEGAGDPAENVFGDGRAASRICDILVAGLTMREGRGHG